MIGYTEGLGCARRENYKRKSMPRMRATFIKKNEKGQDINKYIDSIENGFLVKNIISGNVNPTNGFFNIYCDSGAIIKSGEVTENVNSVFISGIIQDTFHLNMLCTSTQNDP